MNPWEVTQGPQPKQSEWARQQGYLFSTAEWGHVLEGLGCRVLFAWNKQLAAGVVVPIFMRGPFKVAFLGFPIAGEAFDLLEPDAFEQLEAELVEVMRCSLVRGVRSRICELKGQVVTALPEVWIDDLKAWFGQRSKRLVKDLAFAARAVANLTIVSQAGDAMTSHSLYKQTIRGHGGKVRYTQEYFQRLKALCERDGLVKGVSCLNARDRTVGFAYAARHGGVVYYLHGAVDAEVRSQGVGDLLLHRLVEWAHQTNARSFSLMASPKDQPGLLQYKKKWGDRVGYTTTHDVGYGAVGRSFVWLSAKANEFLGERCARKKQKNK